MLHRFLAFKNVSVCLFLFLIIACKPDHKAKNSPTAETDPAREKVENTIELLVGTYTDGESKGVYRYDFNTATGTLGNKTLLAEQTSPTYLCISKDRSTVYTVNRTDPATTTVYKWNENHDRLLAQNSHSSEGEGPCYVALNKAENLLGVANYASGTIAVYSIGSDGRISGETQKRTHTGSGPFLPNQKSAHAHCTLFDASGKFLYVSDLGIDKVLLYPLDSEGKLQEQKVALQTDPGDGPRLLLFHPNNQQVFIINELSSSVVSASINPETGIFTVIDKKSTLPSGFEGNNACADIRLSNDGKYLYASNRGHNSIAIFSVSEEGKLNLLHNEPVKGDWPRNFTLSPDGQFLLVANRKSNTIVVFKIDPQTGLLKYSGNQAVISQPVCLVF